MTSYLSKNTGKEVIHNLKEQAKRQIDFEDAVEEQEEEVKAYYPIGENYE